ncbi:MAG: ABC transporter ATP-binding protein [Lachnospiraceae bacterium]|jgi:NitT/TauT family transport system ATP-binding protein|nr:ABC transporter ATP-binding protein [Lachnospiraceae bacterium]
MKIEVKNLSFSYGEQTVLQKVSFTLTSEQPVVLLGSSGQGKTTLLRLLAGLLTPQGGQISGITASTRIAVMFQEDRLFPQLSVWKNLKLVRPDVTQQQAAALLTELDLGETVLGQLPRELSGGMRRRVALARALLFEADLVLMDEPFQGLDANTRADVLKAVRKWTEGRPLLLISHEPSDAEALGAKIMTLQEIES